MQNKSFSVFLNCILPPCIRRAESTHIQPGVERHAKIRVGKLVSILLLTLRRTTLVGHLSISVNGFESDFLDASAAKHLRRGRVRTSSPSYDD